MTVLTSSHPTFLTGQKAPSFVPRILLAVLNPHHLQSITALFTEYPTETVTATTSIDTLHLLKIEPFDLIIIDMDLPDLEGYVVMDFLRNSATNIDVIILAGPIHTKAAMDAYHLGAYCFLEKPYSPEHLLYNIRNALSKRHLNSRNQNMLFQLMHSEQLYSNLVDHVPDIVCVLNERGQITAINRSVTRILGYQPEELTNQHYAVILDEKDREAMSIALSKKNDGPSQMEIHLHGKGHEHPSPFFLTLIHMDFQLASAQKSNATCLIARDLSENRRAEEKISFHTHYDQLTGLPNRLKFNEDLHFELQNARKHNVGVTTLFIDLDRFKLINDSFGHKKGDIVLKQAAQRLREIARYTDTIARFSSDEFVLCLPGLSEPQRAQEIAGRCLEALNTPFIIDEQETITITASIGIAIYPEDGESVDTLVGNADIAMSHVKKRGKNSIAFYNHNMANAAQFKLSQEYALRRALERNELEMYYQPQINLTTRRIIGAEALMRWNHPELGLLSAGEFLPGAEENGLILPITDWMLEAVCHDIHTSRILNSPRIPISINLSPQYLDRRDFAQKLKGALERHNISPDLIEVEVTENICINNPANTVAQLEQLSTLGIDIAIDDFGTGYSSLSYLHQLPVQTIKIDRSFVNEITDMQGDYPVVLAIISIAHGLGLKLIAEGIETDVQAQYLQKWGCDVMQGYRYYKPMPLQQLLEALAML